MENVLISQTIDINVSVMLDTLGNFANPKLIFVQLNHVKMKDFVRMKIMVINSVVNVLLATMV